MRTTRVARTVVLAMAIAVGAATFAAADEAKPGLDATGSVRDALGKLEAGRDVEIVLANGKSYRGKLGKVGADSVLVTQITGKEFYDVLIDMKSVAAVELRVRGN